MMVEQSHGIFKALVVALAFIGKGNQAERIVAVFIATVFLGEGGNAWPALLKEVGQVAITAFA